MLSSDPNPSTALTAYPVSTLVNNPRHDTPQCLEPVSVQGVHYPPS
jgi:putative SOS response-associated peptidase YedK